MQEVRSGGARGEHTPAAKKRPLWMVCEELLPRALDSLHHSCRHGNLLGNGKTVNIRRARVAGSRARVARRRGNRNGGKRRNDVTFLHLRSETDSNSTVTVPSCRHCDRLATPVLLLAGKGAPFQHVADTQYSVKLSYLYQIQLPGHP